MSASSDKRLVGVRAKIERANQHVRDLEAAMRTFRDEKPYGFRIENDFASGDEIHRIEIRQTTPVAFSLIAGDALHNLRSALDHLAWQAQEADHGKTGRWTYFPICDTPAKYEPAALAEKQKLSPRLIRLSEAVQPYQTGYAELGVIHELNNFDKHRLLLVTAFGLREVTPMWRVEPAWQIDGDAIDYLCVNIGQAGAGSYKFDIESIPGGGRQGFLIHGPFGLQPDGTVSVLENGAEVGRILSPVLVKDQAYLDLSFEVAFGEPAVVKGKPVIPFLTQLSQLVDGIVDQFVPIL